MKTKSYENRLSRLEDETEKVLMARWLNFWEKFSDEEIDALIEGTASEQLVQRLSGVENLTVPRELVELQE